MIWLAVLGILNSVIALYYYLKVMKVMYLEEAVESARKVIPSLQWKLVLAFCIVSIIVLGVIYAPWFNSIALAVADF